LELAHGAQNIEFTDWLDDRQLQQKLGHAIATLYIPEDEDFGMSAVESMAAGKPVITVAEGGLLETQIDGETGLLLPPNPNPQEIAQAVLWLTPERALAMRTACEQRASDFTTDRFLDAFQLSIRLAVGRTE
jgi:glycosyltransferase involved in cell wall biosynthesis